MTKNRILAGLILLVITSLLMSACGAAQNTPVPPTVDANVIYTQAAETVAAGIAQTQAVLPSPTSTQTPVPTNTMDPTMAAAFTATASSVLQPAAATATLAPGAPTPTVKPLTLPTATLAVVAPPPRNAGDKAELAGQNPSDGVSVQKSASFDINITLKNVGTTTWTKGGYAMAFYAGDRLGSPKDLVMPHDVKPGETIRFDFTLTAPDSTGKKKVIWVVRNADGVNFYDLWLEVNVTN